MRRKVSINLPWVEKFRTGSGSDLVELGKAFMRSVKDENE
jgi:hypothetical protein